MSLNNVAAGVYFQVSAATVRCSVVFAQEHIVARDIETHVQVLNYSQQLHECFKGSNSAALFRPHLGTADSYSQCCCFLLYTFTICTGSFNNIWINICRRLMLS